MFHTCFATCMNSARCLQTVMFTLPAASRKRQKHDCSQQPVSIFETGWCELRRSGLLQGQIKSPGFFIPMALEPRTCKGKRIHMFFTFFVCFFYLHCKSQPWIVCAKGLVFYLFEVCRKYKFFSHICFFDFVMVKQSAHECVRWIAYLRADTTNMYA